MNLFSLKMKCSIRPEIKHFVIDTCKKEPSDLEGWISHTTAAVLFCSSMSKVIMLNVSVIQGPSNSKDKFSPPRPIFVCLFVFSPICHFFAELDVHECTCMVSKKYIYSGFMECSRFPVVSKPTAEEQWFAHGDF